MKIKIAFYKAKGNWKNKIIRWWTKSIYSHAELVLPDNRSWISISPFLTSKVDKRDKLEYNKDEWDFIEFAITKEQNKVILDFFEETKGCGYDWFGMIMSQFIPYHIKRKGKWYCSEWIAYALRIAGIINWRVIKIYDRCDLSPGVLHKLTKQVSDINLLKEKYENGKN